MAGNFKITDKSTVNPTVNDYTLVSQNGSTKNTTFARIKQLLLGTTALNTTNTEINGAINEVNDLATNAKSTADSMKTTVGTGILQTTSQNIIGGVNELKTKEEDNKTEILNTIGDEEMGTTATTLKGAIAEHTSQLNEKLSLFIGETLPDEKDDKTLYFKVTDTINSSSNGPIKASPTMGLKEV